ncbi:MAG: hypothetical protein ACRENE_15880, partial [Polyangiaceae bacterium]
MRRRFDHWAAIALVTCSAVEACVGSATGARSDGGGQSDRTMPGVAEGADLDAAASLADGSGTDVDSDGSAAPEANEPFPDGGNPILPDACVGPRCETVIAGG